MYVELGGLIRDFVKKYPHILVVYLIALVMIPLKDILVPHFYGKIVDAINKKGSLWMPFIIVIAIIVIMQVGHVLNDWNEMRMYPEMQKFIRQQMMDNIMSVNSSDYNEQETGRVITKLIRIPTGMYNFLDTWKMYLIPQVITTIIAVGYFYYHDWILGTLLLVVVMVVYYTVALSPKWCSDVANSRERSFHGIHEEVDDILRNLIAIYNSNQLDAEQENLFRLQEDYKQLNKETVTCGLKYKFYMFPILIAFIICFMYRCYACVKNNTLKTGAFVSLFIMMMYIFNSFLGVTGQIRDMVTRVSVINDYVKDMRSMNGMVARTSNITNHPTIPSSAKLHFERVTFVYGKAKEPVIKNMTLDIDSNEKVLIVGRIGSGKSTILRLLMRYHVPQLGEIYYDGVPYSQLGAEAIRKHIGYVPQQPILFNRSIYDNIVYGTPHVTKESVEKLLMDLELAHMFKNMEDGIDTKVGKMGSVLSGGQRQIVWILRVMLQDPEVLLLDEPTASIDESTKDTVHYLLKVLMSDKKRTVIMVSHDDYLTSIATRIIEYSNGVLVSDTKKS